MAVPEHGQLFDQADRLAAAPPAGAPRQVDLRRAISSAYYGLFHFCLAAVADELVGAGQRATSRYALVYRSVDHRTLKHVCSEVEKQTPTAKFAPYAPASGFDPRIRLFSTAVIDLQEKRHRADYDPLAKFRISDAKLAVRTARSAVPQFQAAPDEHRQSFLVLLVCPPR